MRDPRMASLLLALDPVEVFREAFGLEPQAWQIAYLRETRSVVLAKSRQIGATQACAALAIHAVLTVPDALVAIVSPSLRQSTEICTRARQGLERLGEKLSQDSVSLLRLQSGGRVLSLPGSAKSVRGWAAHPLLILDEAGYIEPETLTAAFPLAATGARVIVQSTPNEAAGQFYSLYTSPPAAWARMTVRAEEVPGLIEPDWLEEQRLKMTPEDFGREFEAVFPESGTGGYFSAERLAEMTREVPIGMMERFAMERKEIT